MLTAMARELVIDKGVGETAAAVWRQIQAEHINVLANTAIEPTQAPDIEDAPLTMPLITPALTVPAISNALKFGSRPPSTRPVRRKEESPSDVQFSLF